MDPDIRISVDLYKPDPKILIYHKIVAEELKVVFPMTRIELAFHSAKSVDDDVLNPRDEVLLQRNVVLCQLRDLLFELISSEVLLELIET